MPPRDGVGRCNVTLPPLLEKLFAEQTNDLQWLVLKLDQRLGASQALQRAHLRLDPLTLSVAATEEDPAPRLMALKDSTECSECHNYVPLKPLEPGDHRVIPAGSNVTTVVRVVADSTKLNKNAQPPTVDGADWRKLKLISVAERSSLQVPVAYWGLGPLQFGQEGFTNLNFKMRLGEAKKVKLEGKFADAPMMRLIGQEARKPRVKELPSWKYFFGAVIPGKKSLTLFEADFFIVKLDPLSLGHISKINNYVTSAAQDGDSSDEEFALNRHALALKAASSSAGAEQKGWKEKRQEAVSSYGTAAKQRMVDTSGARTVSESQLSEETVGSSLLAAIENSKKRKAEEGDAPSLAQQQADIRTKFLPSFDISADQPDMIYKKGLADIAPDELVIYERGLGGIKETSKRELLEGHPDRVATKSIDELRGLLRCTLSSVVLRERAVAGMKVQGDETQSLTRKLGAVRAMVNVYRKLIVDRRLPDGSPSDGVVTIDLLAQLVELKPDSRLVNFWFKKFFEPVRQGGYRKIDGLKLLCHLLVYALHLTPKWSLDVAPVWQQRELGTDLAGIEKAFVYIGCRWSTKRHDDKRPGFQKIVAALQAPLNFKAKEPFRSAKKRKR